MRLRRKNSLQASKLPGSLRRLALRSHESNVGTSPAASDSPETLTKRGKISRVSERSIHKIASPRVHDEKEEWEGFAVNRRMTRAMDGEEPGKLEAPRRFKDPGGDKHQNRSMYRKFKNNVPKKAGIKSRVVPASTPAEARNIENLSYRKKLRNQEPNSSENGDDKHRAMSAENLQVLDNDNCKLTRSEMTKSNSGNDTLESDAQVHVPLIQDPKKLSQARAVLKSLRQQQKVPIAGGVITRHRANSTTQAQPLPLMEGESEAHKSSKHKHSEKNICARGDKGIPTLGSKHSEKLLTSSELPAGGKKKKGLQDHTDQRLSTAMLNDGRVLTRTGKAQKEGLSQRNRGRRIAREGGELQGGAHKTSDGQSGYMAVDCAHGNSKRKLKKHGKGGSNGSSFLQHWKKRRITKRMDRTNTSEASIHHGTLPRKASEEGPNRIAQNLKVTPTPRRSMRKRNTVCLSDHEATLRTHDAKPLEIMLQVRGQTGDVAVRDGFCPKGIGSPSIEHLQGNDAAMEKGWSTPKAAETGIGPNLDVFKIDPLSKCYLVATNPTETGGRQMRPRPLDLEQPLLVLVEGANQDYYDFDGGSFYRMLQQQPEFRNTSISKAKSNGSNRKNVDVLDATGEKAEPILIPSFRSWVGSEDGMQNLGVPYVLPNSYIKTSSRTKNLQAEYDMDSEDEEWLNKYNQSVSPASTLSADQFEKIIDLLENKVADVNGYSSISEAFEDDQEPEPEPASEECCICNGGENSNDNTVYQCSTCHILVHRSCYGIQKGGRNIKRKRNWNCRKCEAVAEGEETADLSCALCCKQGGALKPSTELHRWAHVVCALYTNETYFVNPDAMEPIDGLDAADARAKRQKRQCWLCGIREGAVERCTVLGCKALFHVSCGVTQGASFELQHSNHQVTSVRVYCPKHALSALGAANAKPEEGEEKQDEENQSSKGNKSVDHDELSPATQEFSSHDPWSRKQRKRKSLSQSRASGQGTSHYDDKDQARLAEDGCLLDSLTRQECTGGSSKGKKTSEPAKKGRGISERGLGEKEYAEGMIDNMPDLQNANAGLTEGVYLYWVSKRERQGGSLLHCIQQEHAAKQFNIFNSDDDVGPAAIPSAAIPLSQESYPRHSDIDMKVVAARQQLQILQKLSGLVVQRERLKLDIFLLDRSILKLCLAAVSNSQRCPLCKEKCFSIVCSICNRSTCLHCLLSISSGSKCKSWLDYVRLPEYVCLECEKEFKQTHRELACISLVDQKDDGLAGSCILRALRKTFGCDELLESSLISSCKRPLILLPRSDVIQQDNLAMDVFWDQSEQKTALLSDLLRSG